MYLLRSFVQQNKGVPDEFDDKTLLSNFAAAEVRRNWDVEELWEQKSQCWSYTLYGTSSDCVPRWGGGSDRYHRADGNCWTGTVLVAMGWFTLYFHSYDHTHSKILGFAQLRTNKIICCEFVCLL